MGDFVCDLGLKRHDDTLHHCPAVAPGGAAQSAGRGCQTQRNKIVARDSLHRPIRAAPILAILQTPHRFRTKRQLWTYSGFGIETHSSAEHRYVRGQLQRSKKPTSVRGLNRSHNYELKNLFKSAATVAAAKPGEGAETRHPSHRDKRRPRHLISRMLRFSILPHWPVFFQDPRGT